MIKLQGNNLNDRDEAEQIKNIVFDSLKTISQIKYGDSETLRRNKIAIEQADKFISAILDITLKD